MSENTLGIITSSVESVTGAGTEGHLNAFVVVHPLASLVAAQGEALLVADAANLGPVVDEAGGPVRQLPRVLDARVALQTHAHVLLCHAVLPRSPQHLPAPNLRLLPVTRLQGREMRGREGLKGDNLLMEIELE